ncbi:MAG: tetratricopeptide repeat protein [Pirellulaceae bacterium]|nr:tetratricopeptide repeat protein [Pirellulaceae bacterium]
MPSSAQAADFAEARAKYFSGDYEACIELTRAEVDKGIWNDFWSRQLMQALMTVGRYEEARDVYKSVETKFATSLPLRVLAAQAYRFSGEPEKGKKLIDEIPELIKATPWRFSDRENMLAFGKLLLADGEDARIVLDSLFDKALKNDPKFVEALLAIGELAIDKSDYQEAVKSLTRAVELRPEDPQIHYLLAKAWASSDSEKATKFLQAAVYLNPKHIDSLLMQAEHYVDSEAYEEAESILDSILKVNPHQPEAWALRAAMAHLTGHYKEEGEHRSAALAKWQVNPAVDYLIGKKLSQHYRFAEGVTYQRRALKLEPNYLPAKFQLAQDLLRVGRDGEGWMIVDQVGAADKYNVVAFNLKTLQERLAKFTTIEADGLIIRMDAREAKIYGDRVVDLLRKVKQTITAKYELELTEPVTVEIFPQQSDFAIRTFGLPGGAGFLGVCFGKLITANSPASQGESPSNWESVLWHEFCHVVTLQKTNNRMPRWLSEGISVYEELEANSSWGQRMNPLYKKMLQGEDFVPLSKLSGAFLQPKSSVHLQFAYFESSLAVRYLIETHGLPLLRKLLVDLGMGVPIEDAFARRYGDTVKLDESFASYVKKLTDEFSPETDFSSEGLPRRALVAELKSVTAEKPKSYPAQLMLVSQLVSDESWSEAKEAVDRLLALYPDDAEQGGGIALQARIARELNDKDTELSALTRLTELSSDNVPALLRLIQIHREGQAWGKLREVAGQLLAVQPLIATGHEAWIEAVEKLGKPEEATSSLRALQQLDPLDPADLHYRLAWSLFAAKQLDEARREVLFALEETPRYREAQELLLAITEARLSSTQAESPATIQIAAPDLNGSPPMPEIRRNGQ